MDTYATFLLLFVLLISCNDPKPSAYQEPAKAEITPMTAQKATTADTIKPNRRQKPSNYIRSTSRLKTDVVQAFPYDIDLKDIEGKVVNSAELLKNDGKPTIFCFWLTTCYPCRVEMKAIKEAYPQWKKEADFRLVVISTDFQKNYDTFVKRATEEEWPFEAYNDVNREFRLVMPGGLNGLPQTFVVDKNGEIVYHKRKYSTGDEIKLFEKVKEIAKKG